MSLEDEDASRRSRANPNDRNKKWDQFQQAAPSTFNIVTNTNAITPLYCLSDGSVFMTKNRMIFQPRYLEINSIKSTRKQLHD
jgi:hypothetical protein